MAAALPLIVSLHWAGPSDAAMPTAAAPGQGMSLVSTVVLDHRTARVQRALLRLHCPIGELEHGRIAERPISPFGTGSLPGMALFGAVTLLIAHAPQSWHALYDGPVRLGPAVVDGALGSGLSFVW